MIVSNSQIKIIGLRGYRISRRPTKRYAGRLVRHFKSKHRSFINGCKRQRYNFIYRFGTSKRLLTIRIKQDRFKIKTDFIKQLVQLTNNS